MKTTVIICLLAVCLFGCNRTVDESTSAKIRSVDALATEYQKTGLELSEGKQPGTSTSDIRRELAKLWPVEFDQFASVASTTSDPAVSLLLVGIALDSDQQDKLPDLAKAAYARPVDSFGFDKGATLAFISNGINEYLRNSQQPIAEKVEFVTHVVKAEPEYLAYSESITKDLSDPERKAIERALQ
jgi:hypothetical protein